MTLHIREGLDIRRYILFAAALSINDSVERERLRSRLAIPISIK